MNKKPEIVRMGMLFIQVCVPENFSDDQVEEFANSEHGTGIKSKWTIDRSQVNVRAKCEEREGCTHLVLVC
jgi:hypothetical protein